MNYDRLTVIDRINSLKGKKRTDNYKSNFKIAEHLGVEERTVKNWLNKKSGHPDIPFKYIPKICDYLGCDIEYLLDGDMHYKTKEAKDICKITGLTEEAVEILRDKKKGEKIAEIMDFLIKDFGNRESLMSNILLCLEDKKQIEAYKSNKWYSKIIGIIDKVGINLDREDVLNAPFVDFNDEMRLLEKYIEEELVKDGYTEEEVNNIRHDTDEFFFDYRARKTTEDIIKASLQIKATRYIDKYLF